MLCAELFEIINNRENSGVEFKRDDIRPEQLAKEAVAFANFQGGRIFSRGLKMTAQSQVSREKTPRNGFSMFLETKFILKSFLFMKK